MSPHNGSSAWVQQQMNPSLIILWAAQAMQRLWQDTPPWHGSHLVQGQQRTQQVQLAGREERGWVVEKVTAVPNGQQCLEEIQSISSSWFQTLSWEDS